MLAAMLATLAQPLPDVKKGQRIVTSIKVNPELWRRLGVVAQVLDEDKQDLVSEALIDLFEKIRQREGR